MKRTLLPVLALLALTAPCAAQTPQTAQSPQTAPTAQPNTDPAAVAKTHDELRALRDRMVAAVNKGDVDALVQNLDENVVVTFQNAEVCRGRDGVKQYYAKMMGGPERVVESYSTDVSVDELTILYGDATGIAFGGSNDHFKLTDGQDFTVAGRWTATCVKKDGKWEIAAFHASVNMFDNPLVNQIKSWALKTGALALLGGFVVGAGLALLLARAMLAKK